MILFKPEHVDPIIEGRKTQTRRLGQKRWNVGAVHQARTRMLDRASLFAYLRIVAVRRQLLGMVNREDAWAEGYDSVDEYLEAFARVNGSAPLDLPVWVVQFEVMGTSPDTSVDREETE